MRVAISNQLFVLWFPSVATNFKSGVSNLFQVRARYCPLRLKAGQTIKIIGRGGAPASAAGRPDSGSGPDLARGL